MLDDDVDRIFRQTVTDQIEGWLLDYATIVTQRLLRKQENEGNNKPLLEIGIYLGKYLSILMASAARTNSKVVGIDTFQHKPIEMLKENISKFMPELASTLMLYPEPSNAFTAERLLLLLGGKARFISIDGSHEYPDVLHDLRISDGVLDDEGIMTWPPGQVAQQG